MPPRSDFVDADVEKLPWIRAVQITRSGIYLQPAERGRLNLALRAADGTVVSATLSTHDAHLLAACLMIGGGGEVIVPDLSIAA